MSRIIMFAVFLKEAHREIRPIKLKQLNIPIRDQSARAPVISTRTRGLINYLYVCR